MSVLIIKLIYKIKLKEMNITQFIWINQHKLINLMNQKDNFIKLMINKIYQINYQQSLIKYGRFNLNHNH